MASSMGGWPKISITMRSKSSTGREKRFSQPTMTGLPASAGLIDGIPVESMEISSLFTIGSPRLDRHPSHKSARLDEGQTLHHCKNAEVLRFRRFVGLPHKRVSTDFQI